jgi:hypothetical protein
MFRVDDRDRAVTSQSNEARGQAMNDNRSDKYDDYDSLRETLEAILASLQLAPEEKFPS